MIRINLQLMFRLRGVQHGFRFLKQLGFSDQFCSRLNRGKVTRIDLGVLEKLCLALNCTPHDLMEWVPDLTAPNMDDTALNQLQATNTADLENKLHSLSKEDLNNLLKKV